MAGRVVFWDFDGTLAARPGIWSQCLVDVLDQLRPGHGRTREDFAPGLETGFPWHSWQRPHPELTSADAWWAALEPVLRGACAAAGIDPAEAVRVSAAVRACYVDPAYWQVYPDTRPALERLRAAGWRHAVVSNHVPELPELVRTLGLADLFEVVLTSAVTGYEKPHPRMYAAAMEATSWPDAAWMVGDNVVADVDGAEASDIRAILVRSQAGARHRSDGLLGAARIIMDGTAQ